jgi:hypothetical protein
MKLTIYRILTFLLLPMAVFFTIFVLLLLRAAFSNPAMLLPLFLFACIAIYSFTSFSFLIQGIDGKKVLNPSVKDWIKANAIVSVIFALVIIGECIVFLIHPEMLTAIVKQMKENGGSDFKWSEADFEKYLRITSYFFLVYSLVLFVHIIMSFIYLKSYAYLFRKREAQ